jgi:hypothetical protein
MEAALQCIREKMGDIDVDADEIDTKVGHPLSLSSRGTDSERHTRPAAETQARRDAWSHPLCGVMRCVVRSWTRS